MPSIYQQWGMPDLGPEGQSTGNFVLDGLKAKFFRYLDNPNDARTKSEFEVAVKGTNDWIKTGKLGGENYIGQPITVTLPRSPITITAPFSPPAAAPPAASPITKPAATAAPATFPQYNAPQATAASAAPKGFGIFGRSLGSAGGVRGTLPSGLSGVDYTSYLNNLYFGAPKAVATAQTAAPIKTPIVPATTAKPITTTRPAFKFPTYYGRSTIQH